VSPGRKRADVQLATSIREEPERSDLVIEYHTAAELYRELAEVKNDLRKTRIKNTRLVKKLEIAHAVLGWDCDE
jgi:hypothetical protein